MLHLTCSGSRLCDGVSRREFLRVGGLGLAGLTLPTLLREQARAAAPRKVRSVIQLYMWGGPSQLETFDLKPNAPDGIRSLFQPVATNVPGIRICEHLPMLAKMADRYAILRSVTHTGVNHGTSAYHMLTGHIHFDPGTLRHPTPNDYPTIGCAVTRFGPKPKDVPTYVSLPSVVHDGDAGEVPGQGPGMLGQKFAPFYCHGDPTQPDFSIETLKLPADVDRRRFQGRIGLQSALDRQGERIARLPGADVVDGYYEQAFRFLQSSMTQKAFDLAAEKAQMRERYGMHHFGQSCLLARRLVEAGVPIITVYWNSPKNSDPQSWDTHDNSFNRLKDHLLPHFDRAMTALLEDLRERGLIDETLLVWNGEFGRTPKLNKAGGRDHWGFCQSVLMAGGGVKGGQVYGSSDGSAAYAAELPVSPDDLAATIFRSLGVALDHEIRDPQGRPLSLCTGKPLSAIF